MARSARPLSEQVQASRPPDAETPTIELRVLIPMTLGFFFITALLLGLGAVVAVDCTRLPDGRVDVAVEQRVLGLLTIHRTQLADVVRALAVQKSGGPRRGLSGRAGVQLQLTLRDGTEWESMPAANQIVGTPPIEMAERIQALIEKPRVDASATTLSLRWIPWLMCALAVPFVLFSMLFAMVWVNMARRRLSGGGA